MTRNEAERKLKIEVDMLPATAPNRPNRSLSATHITIHNTANESAGADAKLHGRYVKGSDAARRMVSWHYTVDDKRCVKSLPTSEQGFHAGSREGNRRSIGIEICMHKGIDQEAANDRAALLVALLLNSLNIPRGNVVPHRFWSGKNCPMLLLANGEAGWRAFLKQVRSYVSQLSEEEGPSRLALDEADHRVHLVEELPKVHVNGQTFIANARPDTADFRDLMFVPTLIEVPEFVELDSYREIGAPILNQGTEGACTGFGLATVANYLLRTRRVLRSEIPASPRMLYEMARRYDEWPGEQYSGSSARGAMKGWHKHGVCSEGHWEYQPDEPSGTLTAIRAEEARNRPLGAYFRVNHKDLVAMHSAISEVGILYATSVVHEGWSEVGADGEIRHIGQRPIGGHAFAIVAYDRTGFWIQNSWGEEWGRGGFAHILYDDWLAHGTDVWVARLGVPIESLSLHSTSIALAGATHAAETYSATELRSHIISLGNDGQLKPEGTYGTNEEAVRQVFEAFRTVSSTWKKKRILLYAHGGLVPESTAVEVVAENFDALIRNEIFPISFIWHTDLQSTIQNILEDAVRRRKPEGLLDKAKEFLEDRWDDMLEPLARQLTGKLLWDEMKENATMASRADSGGARFALEILDEMIAHDPTIEVHLVGHSAGAIFHCTLAQLLGTVGPIKQGPLQGDVGYGRSIRTCTLWAPACRVELFKSTLLPLIKSKQLEKFALFTLSDKAEQDDDCQGIYRKSLLFLVSNALENPFRIPVVHPDGAPLLGMERFVVKDPDLISLFRSKSAEHVIAGRSGSGDIRNRCEARRHGDYDEDVATREATLARMIEVDS